MGAACGALTGGSPTGGATPPNCTAIIDYIDFVQHAGIFYRAVPEYPNVGRPITDGELGAELFRVKNTLSVNNCDPRHQAVDGDSAFVPSGEPVFAVMGYAPLFRAAARHDGRVVLYEADSNPAARRGADLMDIEGKVKSIALLDQKTGRFLVSRLTEKARVDELVRLVARASVDLKVSPGCAGPGDCVQLAFELNDGTASVRNYDRIGGILWRGMKVGPTFMAAVDELVSLAPTPSPVPTTLNLARRYDLARATRVTLKDLTSTGTARPSPALSSFLSVLDAELPASRGRRPSGGYVVVIFEFPDRYVSLAYEASTSTLTVVAPDDELAVQVPSAFRGLVP
jgi:hypothetical protein